MAWLTNALTYSSWATLAILLVLLFPDGRSLTAADLDRRVETIARRVSLEIVASVGEGGSVREGGSTREGG